MAKRKAPALPRKPQKTTSKKRNELQTLSDRELQQIVGGDNGTKIIITQ
jgi:bacteriocin-like protein